MKSTPKVSTPLFLSAGFLGLILCGCGADAGRLATTPPLHGTGYAPIGDGAGGGPDPGTPVSGEPAGGAVSLVVTASEGGVLVSGRHVLTIPAGALKADQEVTLVDLTGSEGYPCARILPQDVRFRSRCTLETTVSDLMDPAAGAMYWVHTNPNGKAIWSMIDSRVTPEGVARSARIGRAGTYAVISS